MPIKSRNISWGLISLAAICLLFMLADMMNHRFQLYDFEVYYKAANRIWMGQNLYQVPEDGHYIYKYSPVSAIYFFPYGVFAFPVAKCLYWLSLSALMVMGFYLYTQMVTRPFAAQYTRKAVNAIIAIAAVVLSVHYCAELHLGQVNYLLLFLYILVLYSYTRSQPTVMGVWLAISIFIKPFTLIFLPFLVWKKQYRALLAFLCSAVVLFVVPFFFYASVSATLQQYQGWITELQIELSHKQSLLAPANHTIFSVVARYTPLRFLLTDATAVVVYQLVMLAGIGLLFLWLMRMHSKAISVAQQQCHYLTEFSVLIALIPLLAFTSANAFIFAMPVVVLVLGHYRQLKAYEKALLVVGLLFIGGNQRELTGSWLSKSANDASLVSIGTIVLIVLVYLLRRRNGLAVGAKA